MFNHLEAMARHLETGSDVGTATSLRTGIATVGLAAVLTISILPARVAGQRPATPRFRSAVQAVAVTAVVRDRKGRFLRDLKRGDFEVFDRGVKRSISDFKVERSAPANVAIVFDVSGSMHVAAKLNWGRQVVSYLLSALDDRYAADARTNDQAAVFTFHTELTEVQPFTSDREAVKRALETVKPFGETSIYDAIHEAAGRVVAQGASRRAVVVITDGIDTGSRVTSSEAAIAASSVDVPVYVIEVVPPIDHPIDEDGEPELEPTKELGWLAERTGGSAFVVSVPAHASIATRRIVSELRHQYLLAFETGGEPGWHPLEVKTRDRELRVRARAGYLVGRPVGTPEVGINRNESGVTRNRDL
jgi:Ca-activated chloride channel homolog